MPSGNNLSYRPIPPMFVDLHFPHSPVGGGGEIDGVWVASSRPDGKTTHMRVKGSGKNGSFDEHYEAVYDKDGEVVDLIESSPGGEGDE